MMIDSKIGSDAFDLLHDEVFQESWRALYEYCPWATAFQSYEFVSRWYEIYREYFDPVIITKVSHDRSELQGLLTLAVSHESGLLISAGAHQAEYQTWLADPSLGNSFIEEALAELRINFPGRVIVFRYVPPLAPREWLGPDRPWGKVCLP